MKKYLMLILLISISFSSFAKKYQSTLQKKSLLGYYNDGGFDPDRLLIGGSLGMNFFKNGYSAFVYPTVGYSFGRFMIGISAGYNFYHEKIQYRNPVTNFQDQYPFSSSNYSLSLFTRLAILGPLFLHAEPGYNFYKINDSLEISQTTGKIIKEYNRRLNTPYILLGGGFQFPIGDRISFVIYALYDVLNNPLSPYYGYPIIRGGFNYGSFGAR